MTSPPLPPATDAARIREQALDWFVRRRSEDFGLQHEQAFQAWLAADPAHGQAFDRWQQQWQAIGEIPQPARHLLQRHLARELAQASTQDIVIGPPANANTNATTRPPAPDWPALGPSRAQPMPTRRHLLMPAAAVATVAAVAGGIGLMVWNHSQAQPEFAQSFSTPRGQQMEVPLPDGTRLLLDAATRLQVTYYRQRREVQLQGGQAVFAVQADAQRPFHVLAGPLQVRVVGTRFSVRHTPDVPGNAGVHVAVEEGRVRVQRAADPAAGGKSVTLAAQQQIASDPAGVLAAIEPLAATGMAPWREHRVSFHNQRLDHALAELARYGDPGLTIRDPAVAALPITGVFDPRDAATFRRVLPAALPVRLKARGDGVAEVVLAR